MSFFRKLFSKSQVDPEVTLKTWLERARLVKSSHQVLAYLTEIQPLILKNDFEVCGESSFSTKIVIIGEEKHEFSFVGNLPSTILNKDYRYTNLDDNYVLIWRRKPPFYVSLYSKLPFYPV